ncbi:MAG: hypothetical protein WC663_05015 [Patescibacteria group bacterium]|jgi:glycerophosphoryl diester phosphodiesterase
MALPELVVTRSNTKEKITNVLVIGSPMFDSFEVDLMETKDGMLVVGHPSIFQARDYTLIEARAQRGALTIDEMAEIVLMNNLHVFLDLKYEDMGELAASEIRRVGLQNHSVLISWGQQNLVAVRRVDKELKTGWIFNGALEDPAGEMERLGCNYFVTCFYYMTTEFWVKMRNLRRKSKVGLCLRKTTHKNDLKIAAHEDVEFIFVDPEVNLNEMLVTFAHVTTELIDEL